MSIIHYACVILLLSTLLCSGAPVSAEDDDDTNENTTAADSRIANCEALSDCINSVVGIGCKCSQLEVSKLSDMILCVGKTIPDRCPESSRICVDELSEICSDAQEKCYDQFYGSTTAAEDSAETAVEDQCEKELSSKYPSLVPPPTTTPSSS